MLRKVWIEIRSSLWFVPALLVFVGLGLAIGLVELDVIFAAQLHAQSWKPLLNAGAEGARGMLAAIASSMITVAGVAFSITIVTLSLASTQYTPRILRNFMRDRANQFVLGIFVAIFAYCLMVMRTIRGGSEEDGGGFVPLMAVAFGMLLALLSIGCLIFFIHHVAASIQASAILKAITGETIAAIEKLFPNQLGPGEERPECQVGMDLSATHPVLAITNGYVQHLDYRGLQEFAEKHQTALRLAFGPGDFIAAQAEFIRSGRELEDAECDTLRNLIVIGDFRTVEQDPGFGIRQIVDIAMKALSPGVNDTSTAVSCLDYLSAILCELGSRQMDEPHRPVNGQQRVSGARWRYNEFVAKSFDEVRLSAAGNVTILIQMLHAMRRVSEVVKSKARQESLLGHARLVCELANLSVPATYDRARINSALESARAALQGTQGSLPDIPLTA